MLKLVIPANSELYDEDKDEFVSLLNEKPIVLQLEHSLISISRWESIWHKTFLRPEPKTREETISYIECMTMTQNVDSFVYKFITDEHIKMVNDYISDPMTSVVFSEKQGRGNAGGTREAITSDLIYYWMISLEVPFECQKWHLNRLLTLIRICNMKQGTGKGDKMSQRELLERNRALNQARRAKH